jgi:hypothetical protein
METPPISDLARLLATLAPQRRPGVWAWCTLPDAAALGDVRPAAMLAEDEGLSVVVAEEDALRRGWTVAFRSAWITLRVHSDLHAVGLTAAFARALADAGIACNVIAGVHHDHLFVPADRADDALQALAALQAGGFARG